MAAGRAGNNLGGQRRILTSGLAIHAVFKESNVLRLLSDGSLPTAGQRIPMSSMIDIVFLLLVFFVMTFRVASQEGDFEFAASEDPGSGGVASATNLPLRLRLTATSDGQLAWLQLNGEHVESFGDLQARLIGLDDVGALRDVVMTLDCDANLNYEHVIAALDHVTAYRDAGGQLEPLVASTRFAKQR